MVHLGIANSRMKGFFDVWFLAQTFAFEGPAQSAAMRATFERRGTALPGALPTALTPTFSEAATKATQWKAFMKRGPLLPGDVTLAALVDSIAPFLWPPLEAAGTRAALALARRAGSGTQPSTMAGVTASPKPTTSDRLRGEDQVDPSARAQVHDRVSAAHLGEGERVTANRRAPRRRPGATSRAALRGTPPARCREPRARHLAAYARAVLGYVQYSSQSFRGFGRSASSGNGPQHASSTSAILRKVAARVRAERR